MLADLALLSPELALVVTGAIVILADAFSGRGLPRSVILLLGLLGLGVSVGIAIPLIGVSTTAFGGSVAVDTYAVYFKLLIAGAAALVLLASSSVLDEHPHSRGEFVGLVLLCTAALMLLSAARDLITIYISLEISSLSIAFLSAWNKRDARSAEAGLKFFLLSAMSSAILLYGIALIYGLTAQVRLDAIARELAGPPSAGLLLALALIVAGFGFKISAVPFQMWTPDVYEGAPTAVTAYISVASKTAGLAVVLRVLQTALPATEPNWTLMLGAVSLATMTVGNIGALVQSNVKRMLAYSSIAHVGYMLIGIVATSGRGTAAVLFYLLAYAVTNLGAFIAVMAAARLTGSEQVAAFRGLAQRSPWIAFGLAVSLLSLAGLPPFSGFFAKLYIFQAALEQGLGVLVLAGVINSAISLFYYAQVIHEMYMAPPDEEHVVPALATQGISLTFAVAGILLFGIFSSPFLALQQVAAATLAR
jgi:NADH-quinone oxidoreductase subunit N